VGAISPKAIETEIAAPIPTEAATVDRRERIVASAQTTGRRIAEELETRQALRRTYNTSNAWIAF
jgi:hypothetical protein